MPTACTCGEVIDFARHGTKSLAFCITNNWHKKSLVVKVNCNTEAALMKAVKKRPATAAAIYFMPCEASPKRAWGLLSK